MLQSRKSSKQCEIKGHVFLKDDLLIQNHVTKTCKTVLIRYTYAITGIETLSVTVSPCDKLRCSRRRHRRHATPQMRRNLHTVNYISRA